MNQKGIAAILIPLIIVVLALALGIGLFFTGIIKNPFAPIPSPAPRPNVDMTPLATPSNPTTSNLNVSGPLPATNSTTLNPFDDSLKDSNPFSSYQNPFDNLQ